MTTKTEATDLMIIKAKALGEVVSVARGLVQELCHLERDGERQNMVFLSYGDLLRLIDKLNPILDTALYAARDVGWDEGRADTIAEYRIEA